MDLGFLNSWGFWAMVFFGVVFWILHTRWGKSIFGIYWFVANILFFVTVVAAIVISVWFWGMKRVDSTIAREAAGYTGTSIITQSDVDKAKGAVAALLGTDVVVGGQNTYSNGGDGSADVLLGGSDDVVTTWHIRQDAMQILARRLKILAGGTFSPADAPGITLAAFPMGAEVGITCLHCLPGEAGEEWVIVVAPVDSGVDPIRLEVNGKIARNLGVKVDSGSGKITNAVGTGDWATICPDCVEKVSTSQSQPQSVQSDDQGQQPAATPTNQTDQQGKALKIVDKSSGGAWTYTPVGNSCVGVSQTHVDAIPFDTPVTLVETFTGAGWTSYMGSSDLALVDWNGAKVCIFAGAAK